MIHDLTTTEMETIAERYAGHHHCAEFWTGFVLLAGSLWAVAP